MTYTSAIAPGTKRMIVKHDHHLSGVKRKISPNGTRKFTITNHRRRTINNTVNAMSAGISSAGQSTPKPPSRWSYATVWNWFTHDFAIRTTGEEPARLRGGGLSSLRSWGPLPNVTPANSTRVG